MAIIIRAPAGFEEATLLEQASRCAVRLAHLEKYGCSGVTRHQIEKMFQQTCSQPPPPRGSGNGKIFEFPLLADGAGHEEALDCTIFFDDEQDPLGPRFRTSGLILLEGPVRGRGSILLDGHQRGQVVGCRRSDVAFRFMQGVGLAIVDVRSCAGERANGYS